MRKIWVAVAVLVVLGLGIFLSLPQLVQSEKLHTAATGSGGHIRIVPSQADLADVFKTQTPTSGKLAALLATEVLHPLEAKKIIVDLAHASPKVIDDVLAMA